MTTATNGLIDAAAPREEGAKIKLWAVDIEGMPASGARFDPLAHGAGGKADTLAGWRRNARAAGHRVVGELLGNMLNVAPEDLRFDRTCSFCGHPTHGKPVVVTHSDDPIDFSVSYTPDLALVAIALDHHVGVDAQRVSGSRALPEWCFASEEIDFLNRCQQSDLAARVTEAWTRKEAYAKAVGLGLTVSLSSVVAAGTPERWRLPREGWQLDDVPLGDAQLRAAIAYDGERETIGLSRWIW